MKSNKQFQQAIEAGTVPNAIMDTLGRGMNVLASTPFEGLLLSIFDWEKSGFRTVEADGKDFVIPKITSILPESSSVVRQGSKSSINKISDKLAASIGISLKGFGAFSGGLTATYEQSNTQSSQAYYAYVEENLLFGEAILDDENAIYFSDDFINDLANLPDTYDGTNFTPFGNFFEKWGLYFVSSFSLGGALNAFNAVFINQSTSLSSASVDLNAQYNGLFRSGEFAASVTGSASWETYSTQSETQLQILGGTLKTQQALLSLNLLEPSNESVQAAQNWADSISQNPYPLEFFTKPISQLGGSKREALDAAAKDFLTSVQFKTAEYNPTYPPWGNYSGRSNIFINDALAPSPNTTDPGFQVVVLQRNAPVTILSNKFYSYDKSNWQKTYEAMYEQMLADLQPLTEDNIVVLCSADLFVGAFPTPDFANYLTLVLGVPDQDLITWRNWATGSGSDDEGVQLFYVAGVPNLGPNSASTLSQWMNPYHRDGINDVVAMTGATITLKGNGGASILSFQGI